MNTPLPSSVPDRPCRGWHWQVMRAATMLVLVGLLTPPSNAFFVKDPDDEPLCLIFHGYHARPDAFEKLWNKVFPASAFQESSPLREGTDLSYVDAAAHRRTIVRLLGSKTMVFLIHPDDPKDGLDVLVLLRNPQALTANMLGRCLRHLPLAVAEEDASSGYPLTAEGETNPAVVDRDFMPVFFRLILPFFRMPADSDFSMPHNPGQEKPPKSSPAPSKP